MKDHDIDAIHILPIEDLKDHTDLGDDCWCMPRIELVAGTKLIVHNSLDHREYFEKDKKRVVN